MEIEHPRVGDGMLQRTLKLAIRMDIAELDRLQQAIARFGTDAGWSVREIQHCTLACDELVTNIIRHGDPGHAHADSEQEAYRVTCELACSDTGIYITLIDAGVPFNPLEQEDPDIGAALEDRRAGGLGIYFVKQVMDEITYARIEGFNKLVLVKRRGDGD